MLQQSQQHSTHNMQQDPTTCSVCCRARPRTPPLLVHLGTCRSAGQPCIYNPSQPDHSLSHAGYVARRQQSRTSSTHAPDSIRGRLHKLRSIPLQCLKLGALGNLQFVPRHWQAEAGSLPQRGCSLLAVLAAGPAGCLPRQCFTVMSCPAKM